MSNNPTPNLEDLPGDLAVIMSGESTRKALGQVAAPRETFDMFCGFDSVEAVREALTRLHAGISSSDNRGAYENDFVDGAAALAHFDSAEFLRLINNLKARGVSISRWEHAVRERVRQERERIAAKLKAAQAATPKVLRPGSGRPLDLYDPPPWEQPVDGALLVEEIAATIRRFVVVDKHAVVAVSLWCLLTYVVDIFDILPRLNIHSPVMRCGKTSLLKVLSGLARKALSCSNISTAAIFRTIDAATPILLLDEADTYVSIKGGGDRTEEMRGILNSGHDRPHAFTTRLVRAGDDFEPRTFSTFCPMATALIGALPPTLRDRSISISMQRKLTSENVERFGGKHRKRNLAQLKALARCSARWAQDNRDRIAQTEPATPGSLDDRQQTNWEPLLAIAEVIGGGWPELARTAAVALSGADPAADENLGVLLLGDLRGLFEAMESWTVVAEGKRQTKQVKRLSSVAICESLFKMEERPWPEYGRARKPISQPQLARLLRPFGIRPDDIRLRDGTTVAKGYDLKDCEGAFSHYLPEIPDPNRDVATSAGAVRKNADSQGATSPTCSGSENGDSAHGEKGCSPVADEHAEKGEEAENTGVSDGKKEGF